MTDPIDVALGTILVTTSGAVVTATNAPITISLYLGDQFVATNTFTYSKHGDELKFDQPDVVNAWVNSFIGQYNTYDAELVGMQVTPAVGANTVTIEEKLGPFTLSTASTSWYRSPRNNNDTINAP